MTSETASKTTRREWFRRIGAIVAGAAVAPSVLKVSQPASWLVEAWRGGIAWDRGAFTLEPHPWPLDVGDMVTFEHLPDRFTITGVESGDDGKPWSGTLSGEWD